MRRQDIKVLDHGHVHLVDHMGDDLSILRAARVNPNRSWHDEDDARSDAWLIRQLWTHGRTRPFEAVEFQFEVKVPLFILLRWHGYRTWSINEAPAQAGLRQDFYVPDQEVVAARSTTGWQTDESDTRSALGGAHQAERITRHCDEALSLYRDLAHDGWPSDLVQSFLPMSAYTQVFIKTDLLNLFRFLASRYDDQTSYEIRIYAEAMRDLVRPLVPVAIAVWEASSCPIPGGH